MPGKPTRNARKVRVIDADVTVEYFQLAHRDGSFFHVIRTPATLVGYGDAVLERLAKIGFRSFGATFEVSREVAAASGHRGLEFQGATKTLTVRGRLFKLGRTVWQAYVGAPANMARAADRFLDAFRLTAPVSARVSAVGEGPREYAPSGDSGGFVLQVPASARFEVRTSATTTRTTAKHKAILDEEQLVILITVSRYKNVSDARRTTLLNETAGSVARTADAPKTENLQRAGVEGRVLRFDRSAGPGKPAVPYVVTVLAQNDRVFTAVVAGVTAAPEVRARAEKVSESFRLR